MDSTETFEMNIDDHVQDSELTHFATDESSRIGEALIANGKLNQQDLTRILGLQQDKNMLFGQAAKQLGLINEDDLQKVLSQQFNYAYLQEDSQTLSKLLIAAHAPFTSEVENLRSLRSQLLLRWFDQGNKTLAFCSVSKHDGVSQLVANLAIVFSQLNKKTLLIDANLRHAAQHNLFNIDTKVGLSNILANRQGRYQLTRQPSLPNLTILTAGTSVPNPQELLSQIGFAQLLTDLEGVYDIILIDTSPLDLGADFLPVVARSKAAVIVARKDFTLAINLQELNGQLANTGAKVIGSVFQEL